MGTSFSSCSCQSFIEPVFKLVCSNLGDFKEATKTCPSRAWPRVCSIIRWWGLTWWTSISSVDPVWNSSCTFYRPKTQFVGHRIIWGIIRRDLPVTGWMVNEWTPPWLHKNVLFQILGSPPWMSVSCGALIPLSHQVFLSNLRVAGRLTQIVQAGLWRCGHGTDGAAASSFTFFSRKKEKCLNVI